MQDEIICMAREACKPDAPFKQYVGGMDCGWLMRDEHLERFAALVAEATKEKLAKAFEGEEDGQISAAIRSMKCL